MNVLTLNRSDHEIHEIIDYLREEMEKKPSVAVPLVSCKALWEMFFSYKIDGEVITFINEVLDAMDETGNEKSMIEFCNQIKESELFDVLQDQDYHDEDNAKRMEDVMELFHKLATYVPDILSTVTNILENLSLSFHCPQCSWNRKFMKLALQHSGYQKKDGEWRKMAIIPTVDEMLGSPLESDSNLRPVQRAGAYR